MPLSVYAISVVGYVTAAIASYLIGRDTSQKGDAAASESSTLAPAPPTPPDLAALHAEVAALRDDLAHLRQDLAARNEPSASAARDVATSGPRDQYAPTDVAREKSKRGRSD